MKCKLFCILITLSLVLILLKVDAFSKDCPNENIKTSAHHFITQYYKELLGKADKSTIKQYYLEPVDKETLAILDRAGWWMVSHESRNEKAFEAIIQEGVSKKTDKFEFQEMTIISKKPLIIGIQVKESNKSEEWNKFAFDEIVFILKDNGACSWKIVDIIVPGLP